MRMTVKNMHRLYMTKDMPDMPSMGQDIVCAAVSVLVIEYDEFH
ncbi:MAG: hypothetical protein ACLTLQ_13125 [[Clostridium] scindens]